MKYLITGGCGFLGSNIAGEALQRGAELVVFDSLYRHGSIQNLEWLEAQGDFQFIYGDIRNVNDVEQAIKTHKPDVIFHLAGQVAMTTSITDPRLDFEVNAAGSFNLLNAVRLHSPDSAVIYSSTNKVYGDLEQYTYREAETRYECVEMPNGFDESVPLDFHSPYGVSKGSADQYMLDFARIYGLKTVVLRHSSMYGGRQFATYDQGWLGWFVQKAIEVAEGNIKERVAISGTGKQVRDLLFSSDCVSLYFKAAAAVDLMRGQAFNIGGGIENSLSILELFALLELELEIKMDYSASEVRQSDQRVFVANNARITDVTGWTPTVPVVTGVRNAIQWAQEQRVKRTM